MSSENRVESLKNRLSDVKERISGLEDRAFKYHRGKKKEEEKKTVFRIHGISSNGKIYTT